MIKFALFSLLAISVSGHFFEPPNAEREKHNDEDELFPRVNILGFTDLDVLDFFSGAAERGFDRDVRQNWHNCFRHTSLNELWNRMISVQFLKILMAGTFTWFMGDKRATTLLEPLLPHQCKHMALEVGQIAMWFRIHMMNPLNAFSMVWNGWMEFRNGTNDIFDILRRLWEHDFYEIGKDYADILLEMVDQNEEQEMSESDYKELPIDSDSLMNL